MIHANATVSRAILQVIRRKNMTPAQLLDFLCPPPKFTSEQVHDTLASMLDRGTVELTPERIIRRAK
jgi:hypothetical protein